MSKHQRTIKNLRIAGIQVLGNHRPLVQKKVRALAASMNAIDLKTPITIRNSKKGRILVAGRHRLEAARSLGWSHIQCIVMDGNKIERQQWAIAENLHRAGLTKLQRAELIDRWDRLLEQRAKDLQMAQPGGRQPHDRGISRTAKALGTTRDNVRRSKKIAGLSGKAKKAAKRLGLDDDESALLKAAKEAIPKRQTKKVRELAKSKQASRRGSFSPREAKQLKGMKKAYARARKFKKAWKRASVVVRKKFITTVLKPTV